MYFPMELKHNPSGKYDIEMERRKEILEEFSDSMATTGFPEEDDEKFDATPRPELDALLPYYNQVEDEALKVARRYFHGTFIADSRNVQNQKLFEYIHNGHTYRCYVDIYNESEQGINIIEVKATTNSKYILKVCDDGCKKGLCFSDKKGNRGGTLYPLFIKDRNIWHFNTAASTVTDAASENFEQKKSSLLNRYSNIGKYPHDLAFQRFVIEHALRQAGDNRHVNYYLAVLNSEYVYDGAVDENGKCTYNNVDGQEIVTFLDMNETTKAYQETILKEIATLESYISTPHDVTKKVDVGKHCAWGGNTECLFWKLCFQKLRDVPDTNSANRYLGFRGFNLGNIADKYQLINEGYYKFDDVPREWLEKGKHHIQRDCYDNDTEYIDRDKMRYWFGQLEYPIYHFDFETFACPLPRFHGEEPYRQSVFEFSLHIERDTGVWDKNKDNFIFLNEECSDDERRALVEAIIEHFEFNEDGTLKGTMLAQNTGFEIGRLKELAKLFPEYRDKLLAICDKSADLLHLLRNNREMYKDMENADVFNYYHKDLSGSYSIKKTLPTLVPSLTYKGMNVGNGVQAYIAYINYDSPVPTAFDKENKNVMKTKAERREALKRYCQQDTWAMVEILRAVREKIY
jgi:hypothetical protein